MTTIFMAFFAVSMIFVMVFAILKLMLEVWEVSLSGSSSRSGFRKDQGYGGEGGFAIGGGVDGGGSSCGDGGGGGTC